MSHPRRFTANRTADADALRKDTSEEHQNIQNHVSAQQQRATCTLVCYCRVSCVQQVLHAEFVFVGSFFTRGEGTRKEDCLTYRVHSCRTALQHRVKFVRTLTSQKETAAKRNFKHGQEKNNTNPTDTHSNGEKKRYIIFQIFQVILGSDTQK